jgi:biotin operon repressor
MTDTSRNQKLGMQTAILEAMAAEELLRSGCTITQLAESLQCSTKKARNVVQVLRRLGCDIPEAPAGIREEWVYRMTGKSKMFARYG